jgi:mannose-1-phosphate guanylyltransferase
MQAVILAGGLGTRLWPLTREVPKPMAPVNGVPFLEIQVRDLVARGVEDILMLTGHLGDRIEAHFGDGSRWGARVRYSREPRPLGTGGALRLALPLLADPFLLLYGDSFLPADYARLVAMLDGSPALGVLAVYRDTSGETTVSPNVALDGDRVAAYDKRGSGDHVEAGLSAFRRAVVPMLGEAEPCSLEAELFPRLAAGGLLLAWRAPRRFYDIGTPARLREAEEALA